MARMLSKKIKTSIAKVLILALILSSNAMYCFANSINETVHELSQEESVETVYEEETEETEEGEVEEPEENSEEESEETFDEPEEETEETEEIEEDETEESEENSEEELEETSGEHEEDIEATESEIDESEAEETEETTEASDSEVIDEAPFIDFFGIDTVPELFGASVPQTVILDFGFGPQFDKSTNWAGDAFGPARAKFTQVDGSKYSITGNSSEFIINTFTGTTYPSKTYGNGEHVELPAFDTADNTVWEGYKFVCWKNPEGEDLTSVQNGTFLYAYQNSGDITYTANWEKVENFYHQKVEYVSERTSTQSTVFPFGGIDMDTVHRGNVYVQPISIPGFKIDKVSPRVNGEELPTNPLDALKTLSYDGTSYLSMSNEDISVNAAYEVNGAMPNHDLDIKMCYVPNDELYKFTIKYIDMNSGGNISADNIQNINAETLLDYKPLEIENYRYENAVVECGPQSIASCILGLGTLTLDGQIIAPTDKNDESANQGRFYALMPNQDVTITYYYSLISDTTPVTVNTRMQKRDGSYDVTSQVIDVAPSLGEILGSFQLLDKSGEGYGAPIVTSNNPTTLIITQQTVGGDCKFYTKSYAGCSMDVVYNYDYTSAYWGLVRIHAYNTEAGHGYIEAASGSMPLDTRYFKRGEYIVSELLEDVNITPATNYLSKVFRYNTVSPGPMGEEYLLGNTIQLNDVLEFFISFEEDPTCWIDIYFAEAEHSSLEGDIEDLHIHVTRDTPVASLSYPTVVVQNGYIHVGGYWQDENNNILADPMSNIPLPQVIYYPVVESVIGEYAEAVKPVVYTEYNSNNRGTAYLYTKYQGREYILTDRNDKILSIKTGSQLSNGFTDLYPGTTYHLYEVLSGTSHPAVGGTIVAGAGISDKCVFGISSVKDNYSYNEANSKITVTPAQGVSYALLDDQYNITYNWTTNPQFSNLVNGTYYLIVAKQTSDTITADHDDAIRNGVAVFTEKVDLSTRYSRVVVIGTHSSVQNMSPAETIGIVKIYKLQNDRPVTLISATNTKWKVCSENANLSSSESFAPSTFVTTREDTIIRNYIEQLSTLHYKAEYHTQGTRMAFINEHDILTRLNEDTNIHNALDANGIIKHYIAIKRMPAKKSVVTNANNNGKIAPYEYSVEIISEVNEKPYPNSKSTEVDLSVYLGLSEEMVGNKSYTATNGSFAGLYTTTTDTDIGSGKMTLSTTENVALMYEKLHRIEIKSSVDDSVNDVFFASDNKKMSESISDYSTSIQNRFANYFDMSNVTQQSVSTYNAKEYLYQGVYKDNSVYDATNSIIKKQTSIEIRYTLNSEREQYKELLSMEINGAVEKRNSLNTQSLRDLLDQAILDARAIKDFQTNYTVEEIRTEYETLHDLIINTNDPPEEIEITLDANGGTLSENIITVYKGNEFTYATLSNVSKSREGYSFSSWNTAIDGTGTTIVQSSIVGNNPPTVLYAIWQVVHNTPTTGGSGGSGGGGGGGSGGGARAAAQVGDQVLVNPLPTNPIEYNKTVVNSNSNFPLFSNAVVYSDEKVCPYYVYDQNKNTMSLHFVNIENYQMMTNQLFIYERHVDDEVRYQAHLLNETGTAVTGFQVLDNLLYYFNEEEGEEYSTLKTGWIQDKKFGEWFYASEVTGNILTGWQSIDGKDYYFLDNKSKVAEGNTRLTVDDIKNDYGVMLKSCITPDGYMLDENGARIIIKP